MSLIVKENFNLTSYSQANLSTHPLDSEDTLTKIAEFVGDKMFSLVCKNWHAANRNVQIKNREFALLLNKQKPDAPLNLAELTTLKESLLSLLKFSHPSFHAQYSKSSLSPALKPIDREIYTLLQKATSTPEYKTKTGFFLAAITASARSMYQLTSFVYLYEIQAQKEGKDAAESSMAKGFLLSLALFGLTGFLHLRGPDETRSADHLEKCSIAALILRQKATMHGIRLPKLPAMNEFTNEIFYWFEEVYKAYPALKFIPS